MYKQTTNIETQLQKIANENHDYSGLWATWNLNKKTLEPILSAIIKDYPHYSFHDHSHSESIILNIERLLGDDNISKLSPTDLWLLLHVAYLHDFGMVILDTKIHDFWLTDEFQSFLKEQTDSTDEDLKKAATCILNFDKVKENYSTSWPLEIKGAVTLLISTYCRAQHANYSKDYILDIDNIWGIDLSHNGLIKRRLVSLLADISAMHTKPFEDLFKLHKEANGFNNDYIHPRLIACLLRLGDALDLDNGRFNPYGEKIFGEMPSNSKVHFEKHESTRHVLINDELIEVEADCPTDEIYRETRKWYDALKSEMDNLHLRWNEIAPKEFSYPPTLKPYKILRNGIEDSHDLTNLKFSISQSKAFEILEGSSIYPDKFSCIRELVQNAEDATKIQLWRDIKSGMYYSINGINKSLVESGKLLPHHIPEWIYKIYAIQINVEKNDENNAVVSVIDHGTGVSIDALKAICNVGQSYFQEEKRKKEIEDMPVWLRPTANFGIGLQSCFLVTDKITIYTNSTSGNSYKLTFKSGKQEGYVNVESLMEPMSRGSNVVIELKNNLNFSFDIMGFAAKNIMKFDPFKADCAIMYKIIESVLKECGSSFFDITVYSNGINYKETIDAYFSSVKFLPHEGTSNDCFYSFVEDKGVIVFWYKNNLYTVTPNKISAGRIFVKFKGKKVNKTKIFQSNYPGFVIDVDIYGLATRDALSLSRDELNLDASSKITQEINFVIKLYFELILKNLDNMKYDSNIVDTLFLTAWKYEMLFPSELCDNVSKEANIRILIYDDAERTYKPDNCSLHDIIDEYPGIPFIDIDVFPNETMSINSITESRLIKLLKPCDIDTSIYSKIIIDEALKRYLRFSFCDIKFLNSKPNLEIRKVKLDDTLFSPDPYTRGHFIRELVYDSSNDKLSSTIFIMRRAIPAFKEYEPLAVELHGLPFVGVTKSSKWYIISPITLEDAKKINKLSKEAFIDYIVEQDVFNDLVKYVSEHGRENNSSQVITGEYNRLIAEYYETVKEEKDD